jgi:hypothetical protein
MPVDFLDAEINTDPDRDRFERLRDRLGIGEE